MRWYVLQFTQTRFNAVFNYLDGLKLQWFCPMEQTTYARPDKLWCVRHKQAPLFPGYLFVRIDFSVTHSTKITAYQYISRFIAFGAEPVPVADDIVQSLYDRESTEKPIGIKSISHEFAEILLIDDSVKRSIAFINYITGKSSIRSLKQKEIYSNATEISETNQREKNSA